MQEDDSEGEEQEEEQLPGAQEVSYDFEDTVTTTVVAPMLQVAKRTRRP